jgi:hypothetical protein
MREKERERQNAIDRHGDDKKNIGGASWGNKRKRGNV